MSPNRISIAVTLVSLLLPGTALAYVSPEDVLFSPEFTPPPTSRTAQDRVEAQRQESARQRAAALEQLHGAASEEPVEHEITGSEPEFTDIQSILELLQQETDSDVHYSAPNEEPVTDEFDDGRSTREERILERISANQQGSLHGSAPLETLHSGAPLSSTGPGLMLAGTALLAGSLWTIRRSARQAAQTLQ